MNLLFARSHTQHTARDALMAADKQEVGFFLCNRSMSTWGFSGYLMMRTRQIFLKKQNIKMGYTNHVLTVTGEC
jgi:hypothetical protein